MLAMCLLLCDKLVVRNLHPIVVLVCVCTVRNLHPTVILVCLYTVISLHSNVVSVCVYSKGMWEMSS